jgi:carbon-monoxide dehydrogenase large subunit
VAPDVGGGFGSKLQVYGEEAVALAIARRLGQPVKWIETRSENMMCAHHGRDQINYVTLGAKRDGTITACRARIIADLGAKFLLLTPFIPELGFPVMGGCYKIPAIDLKFEGVFTNKICTDAIRGAGRPEATYWIELMMNKLADQLGMDRLELRRKNFIGRDEFPFTTALGITYDSGDYHGTLDRLLVSKPSSESRASTAASASRPGSRSAGLHPLAPSARRESGSRVRSGNRRWYGSTRRARRRFTPALLPTARASTRASRRSRQIGSVSTRSRSR